MKPSRRIGQLVAIALVVSSLLAACSKPASYDLILRGGTIVDGTAR